MQIQTRFESGAGKGEVSIPVEIPEPLSNGAGQVHGASFGRPKIEVIVDDAMRAAGITRIDEVGYVDQVGGQQVLRVKTNKGAAGLALASRPDLQALIDNQVAISRAMDAARSAFWAQETEERDGPLLAEMNRRKEELVAQIPADHVRVTVEQVSEDLIRYSAEGVDLRWDTPGMVRHGVASAQRPGALGCFACEIVTSIPRATLEALRQEQDRSQARKADAVAARERDLLTTPVPPAALAAYLEYNGDANRAWERGEETDWALINQWRYHIEAQELAPETSVRAVAREVGEALRREAVDL
jgi:hypothetical protein